MPVVPQHASFAEFSQHVVCATAEQQAVPWATASSSEPPPTRARTGALRGAATSNSASLTNDAVVLSSLADPQLPPVPAPVEQTPVSGKTSSTFHADSQSPTSAATTERTCS